MRRPHGGGGGDECKQAAVEDALRAEGVSRRLLQTPQGEDPDLRERCQIAAVCG